MFERFTQRAQRTVALALDEALRMRHNYLGTEHLLLGLIAEGDGVAAKALASLGVSLDSVREDVARIIGIGSASPRNVPFTPRARTVLELSLREATQLGHDYIGTEHILLGIVQEGEGVAAQVLERRVGGLQRVRKRVIHELSGAEPPSTPADIAESELRAHMGEPRSIDERLADIELALQPLPDLLSAITGSLDTLVARVESLERGLGGGQGGS